MRCIAHDSNGHSSVHFYFALFLFFAISWKIVWKLELDVFYSQVQNHDNVAVLLLTTIEAIYAFGVLFIACELCQHVNCAFNECSDMIDQFAWYWFPANVKQILPTILNFTQQPVVITCFGSTTCDRETFKYVSGRRY